MPIHNVHAVTGYAGALVWDISPVPQEGAALPVPTPFQPSGPSSTMTTCLWVAFVAAKRDLLVIGNVQGDIIVWSIEPRCLFRPFSHKGMQGLEALATYHVGETPGCDHEIVSLAANTDTVAQFGESVRIGYASLDGHISVIRLSVDGDPTSLFRHDISSTSFIPRHLSFLPASSDLIVFSLHFGTMKRYDHAGNEIWTASHGPKTMGYVSLLDSRRFVAYVEDHFELVGLEDGKILKKYDIGPQAIPWPKDAAFVENGSFVSKPTQLLKYEAGNGNMVQPVTACDVDDNHYIAIAGTYRDKPSSVMLWRKRQTAVTAESVNAPGTTHLRSLIFKAAMGAVGIVGCVLFMTGQI
ncbi:hypothetical protein FB107DRAFT_225295 [Schizophyllum commune]